MNTNEFVKYYCPMSISIKPSIGPVYLSILEITNDSTKWDYSLSQILLYIFLYTISNKIYFSLSFLINVAFL